MVEVPRANGVKVVPLVIVATEGLEEVKVQAPGDSEEGAVSVKLATLSFMIVMLPNVPIIGSSAMTVSAIRVYVLFQFDAILCMAVIVTVPPSSKVTVLPKTEAICAFDDE
jgi:hypothetical protein